jgi:uncharacterized protein (DUF924 family)
VKAAKTVLNFWFGEPGSDEFGKSRKIWFQKNDALDAELRLRFGFLQSEAARGRLDAWQTRPKSALALILLLDQVSRNIYRGEPASFATDSRALAVARNTIAKGFDRGLLPVERWFVYMPFEHAEDMASQRESLRLFASLRSGADGKSNIEWAKRHYDIIARFGRFPHRNGILGRESTAEEIEFLKQPGSGF